MPLADAPYGSGENYRPLVRRFAATIEGDRQPQQEQEELEELEEGDEDDAEGGGGSGGGLRRGSAPIKPWATAGYSGYIPFARSTLASSFRGSVQAAEAEWKQRRREVRSRSPDSPPRELVSFSSSLSMSASFGQRSPEPRTPEPKYHIPGYTGYIPANKNISSRGYSSVTRAAFNSHNGIDTELIRTSGELIMEPNRAAPGCLPVRPNNIGEPTMSHPWCYIGPS